MIKILIFSLLFLGLWFAYEVGRWWKETEDDIRIWPEDMRRNKGGEN